MMTAPALRLSVICRMFKGFNCKPQSLCMTSVRLLWLTGDVLTKLSHLLLLLISRELFPLTQREDKP